MSQDLSVLIAKEMAAYSKEFEEEVDRIADEVATETVQELKQTSPKRSGQYARSWRKQRIRKGTVVVYNSKKGPLVHLLEYGHVQRGGGRVAGVPHMKSAEEKALQSFQQKVKEIGR